MELKIKDKTTGIIYSNVMSDDNKHCILSMNFCTSYTEVQVQDEINENSKVKDLILPPLGSTPNWVDLIATQNNDEGEWVTS